LGLPELSKVIIFVGRMVREMGLHTVLAAAPRLLEPDGSRHLVIVGARGALTAEAENLARRFPGHVHVLPDLADADLPAAYALSTVAVAPSTNERACLGLAIIEAMASGLPVVGCAVGGTAEVVVDGETGTLIPPESPEDLVRATERYLSDRALARVHGHRGRIRAVEHFDLGVVNRRIESMFLDLIRSSRERASGGTP